MHTQTSFHDAPKTCDDRKRRHPPVTTSAENMPLSLTRVAVFGSLLLLSLAPCRAQGTNSLVLNGSSQGAIANLPNSSPYNAIGNVRLDVRVTNLQLNIGTRQRIFAAAGAILCAILENTNTLSLTDFLEAGSPTVTVDLTGRTDISIRFQKVAGGLAQMAVCNSDGTNCSLSGTYNVSLSPKSWSGELDIGFANPNQNLAGRIAYFRGYSTTLALATAAPPNNQAGGDLFDWEFENNGKDSSGHGITLTMSGNPGYATTPFFVYLPADFSSRASFDFALNGSGTAASLYFWTQLSGADNCTFSNRNVAVPTLSGCVLFGQRTFQLTATDAAGQSASGTINVGMVPTNSSGVVVVADPKWNFLLGPLVMDASSASPWSWFDSQRKLLSYYWYSSPTTAPGGAWPTTFAGSEENLTYYCSICALYRQYYRTGLTVYQTWARTLASTVYAYSDGWNSGAPTGGCASNWVAPRDSTADGILYWLYDTGANLSASSCIQQYVDYEFNNYLELRDITQGYQGPYYGTRESGYAYDFAVYLSQISNVNVNTHGLWSTRIASEFANYWLPYQCPSSYNAGCSKITTQIAGTVTTNGTTALVGTGTAFTTAFSVGMTRAVVTYGGSGYGSAPTVTQSSCSGCVFTANMSGGSVASITINAPGVPTSPNFLQNLTFTGGSPATPATGYTEAGHVWFDNSNACGALAVDATWAAYPITAITDNTHMTLQYAPSGSNSGCLAFADSQGAANDAGATRWQDEWPGFMEQPWHVTIGAEGIARYYSLTGDSRTLTYLEAEGNELANQEYNNASCVGTTVRSVYYAQYSAGPYGAGCATATDLHADRADSNTVPHIFGWLYKFTGNAMWKTYGDNFFSALFGDSGPGPGTDGYFGQFDTPYGPKFYGQSLRSADAYLALRLGSAAQPAAINRAVSVGVNLAAGPSAPQVRVTLTQPDGQTVTNTCTMSPCTVNTDAQQGGARLRIQRLGSDDTVKTTVDPQPIKVQ